MTRFLALIAYVVVSTLGSTVMDSWAEQSKATTTYSVPTTGEIMDVIYLPEFDEWWVKCREGSGVSIYSYDKRSKKWGHARFVPRKTVKKRKNSTTPEKSTTTEKETPTSKAENQPAEKSEENESKPDAGSVSPRSEHGAETTPTAKGKKKWWDPLQLLKGNKKTVSPAEESLP